MKDGEMAEQSLLEDKLKLADPIIDRYIQDPSIEAVCITGSLIAGLGTSYSDVDLFAITAPGHQIAEPTVEHGVGLDRVEVEIRSPEWLNRIGTVAQPFRARLHDNTLRNYPTGLVADAVRIKIGRIVKHSHGLDAVREKLDSGSNDLRRMMIAYLTSDVGDDWMDVLGFLSHNDFESAEIVSREILEKAIDCSSVQEGDLYRGKKWVWSRARRNGNLKDALPWLRWLFIDGTQAGDQRSPYALRMLAAQKIIALAALREWCPKMSDEYPVAPVSFALGGYTRSQYWMLVRLADSAILLDRDMRHYTAPDLAVACWAAADGVSRPSLASSVRTMVPTARNRDIEAVIDKLLEIEAITPTPNWRL
jgi:hypothetical protein